MFRAIGMLILIVGLSNIFTSAATALERALTESFAALETAAKVTQLQMSKIE